MVQDGADGAWADSDGVLELVNRSTCSHGARMVDARSGDAGRMAPLLMMTGVLRECRRLLLLLSVLLSVRSVLVVLCLRCSVVVPM